MLLIVANTAIAQVTTAEKADYFFSELLYAEAIPEYEKLLKTSSDTDYVHQKLAECHLMMRNVEKARPHLKAAVRAANPPPPDFYFMYGMALYSIGDHTGAEKWLKKYETYGKNDVRIKTFLQNGTLVPIVFNQGEHYEIEPVNFNSIYSDFGAFVKENTLYFSSARTNDEKEKLYGWNGEPWLDIYKLKENDPLSKPVPLPGNVNSDFHESSMAFSINHKKQNVIYFTGNKYFKFKGKNYINKRKKNDLNAKMNLKIFSAIRSSGEWKVNQDLAINSYRYSTGHPFVTTDGKRIYFTSDRPGGYGGSDIYYAPIHKRGGIGKPVNAGPVVNTTGNEMFPFVDKDGRLFFTSDGHVGYGQLDIFSTVLNLDDEIAGIVNLGMPINSPSDDFAYFEKHEGGTGYISSNREGGVGSDDIYKFKFTPSLSIEGRITDRINNKALDSVSVTIYDEKDNTVIANLLTDRNGNYYTYLNRKSVCRVEVSRKTHSKTSDLITADQTPSTVRKIPHNISLEPIMNVKVLANLDKINFNFDKSDIRPDAAFELDKVVKLITTTYPEMKINIEVHTVPLGSHTYNDKISAKRAESIYNYLIENGVHESRIVTHKGYGKRKSINNCAVDDKCTNKELEQSRRVEFPIIQLEANGTIPNSTMTKNK